LEQFLGFLQRFGLGRLAAILGVSAGVAAALFALVLNLGAEPKALLYSNLDMKEASSITQALDQAGVKYEAKGDGSTIMVPRDKARELIQSLGYTAPPDDSASGFYFNQNFLDEAAKDDKPLPHWDEIARSRPAVLTFWYRQSPEPMLPRGLTDDMLIPGTIDEDDPQRTMSGMIDVRLDPQGRLVYFEEIPPEKEDPAGQVSPTPDWKALFAAAGLDMSKFKPATPIWTSLAASDLRQAWTGQWPGYKSRPLRVEAAAWRGRPVFFSLYGPWTRAGRMPSSEPTGTSQAANERYLEAVATVAGSTPLAQLTDEVCRAVFWHGQRQRGLNPLASADALLLEAINRGEFVVNGFRNRDLRGLLLSSTQQAQEVRRQSAAITRKLRLLRAHGLIRKIPKTHRYQVSPQGREIITAILAARQANTATLTQAA